MSDVNKHPGIKIDLFSDWAIFLRRALSDMGYKFPDDETDDQACLFYYDIEDRVPYAVPREIRKSGSFMCPAEHLVGLSLLEDKIRQGIDIKSHLSCRLLESDNLDGLLLDWGIHHLHLGTSVCATAPDFTERTGPVLLARFTSRAVYFIGIREHGHWSDQDYLRILHRNWPAAIEQYRVKDSLGLEFNVSDSDIGMLRTVGFNTLVEIEPGVIYCNPGGGITLRGSAMTSSLKLGGAKRFFCWAENLIIRDYKNWRTKGMDPDGNFDFHLDFYNNVFYAFCIRQRLAIKIKAIG